MHRNPLPHPFASSYHQQSLSLSNPLAGRCSNKSVARQQVHVNKLELCWSLNRQHLLLRLQLAMPRHSTVGRPQVEPVPASRFTRSSRDCRACGQTCSAFLERSTGRSSSCSINHAVPRCIAVEREAQAGPGQHQVEPAAAHATWVLFQNPLLGSKWATWAASVPSPAQLSNGQNAR